MKSKDKIIEEYQKREKDLTIQLILVNDEISQILSIKEQRDQLITIGGIIGGRSELIRNLFRELFKNSDYKKRWIENVNSINKEKKKIWEEMDKLNIINKFNYIG